MSWFDDNVMRPESAGFFGAVLGLFNAPGSTWRERTFNLFAGIGAAWFVAPWATELFSVETRNGKMCLAFLVGVVGMNLVAKVIDQVKQMKLQELREWLPPFLRRGPGDGGK